MARKSHRPNTAHTVLVVDDQEETLISVRSLLEREGHRVLTAESGERALAVFKGHDIHLLLVDYFMPRMTGEQLIREIRTFDPFVQIILQTGYSGDKPPQMMLADLDIQGYHDKADGPERLLLWVDVGLKAYRTISALRERERLQRELVANVSHEFRTPLNIISGYASLLLDATFGPLPTDILQPLQRIDQAGHNLTELVEDFLKYAKLEAGVVEMGEREIDTLELANELTRLATLLIDEGDIRFVMDVDQAPPAFVSDAVKLRTILRNLITNAVKFTASGTVSLRIAGAGSALRFEVRDTGPGIEREHLGLIFEPFRQIDGSSTRRYRGIGLGLALAQRLARLLGGTIEVQSEVGRGSTFTLLLPALVAPGHNAAATPSPVDTADGTDETATLPSAVGFS